MVLANSSNMSIKLPVLIEGGCLSLKLQNEIDSRNLKIGM